MNSGVSWYDCICSLPASHRTARVRNASQWLEIVMLQRSPCDPIHPDQDVTDRVASPADTEVSVSQAMGDYLTWQTMLTLSRVSLRAP